MAEYYIKAIRNIQPEGPYYIGGWSAGGVIAFEIAQQLLAEGIEIQPILIDTNFPGIHMSQINSPDENTKAHPLPRNTSNTNKDAKVRLALFGDEQSDSPNDYTPASTLRATWSLAATNYNLKIFPGSAHLIMSTSYDGSRADTFSTLKKLLSKGNTEQYSRSVRRLMALEIYSPLNWRHATKGELSIRSSKGSHHSLLFTENVPTLAQHIMGIIDSNNAKAPF